jgi:hypothetical protein
MDVGFRASGVAVVCVVGGGRSEALLTHWLSAERTD